MKKATSAIRYQRQQERLKPVNPKAPEYVGTYSPPADYKTPHAYRIGPLMQAVLMLLKTGV